MTASGVGSIERSAMYLPRLRARQHEILAVRDCAAAFAAAGKVVPIIEPVKPLDQRLVTRLEQISSLGLSCSLVLNPSSGDHKGIGNWKAVGDFFHGNGLLGKHNLAVLSNGTADHTAMAAWVAAKRRNASFQLDLVHETDRSISLTGSTYRDVRWNVADDRTVPATYGLPLGSRPVVWSQDPFLSLERNVDYWNQPESIFSTRPWAYRSAGYVGVSDFLTIGKAFKDGGGPAYAVVIHLTYEQARTIRIRHFCSDTNLTQDDTAGKFFEALEKLVTFVRSSAIPTNFAVDSFLDLHRRQHFPGLGKVKELSMENHMIVMQNTV